MESEAFQILRQEGGGPFVIYCDHASNRVPPELHNLGLPEAELQRHIAWDIGAAGVCAELSQFFDSPAILCGTSRLVIDCNRHPGMPDSIPRSSDRTTIPGNLALSEAEMQERVERWFDPYHAAVESVFERRQARGLTSFALSIHSMTPSLAGNIRPWQISLSSVQDRAWAGPMLEALRHSGDIVIGDNQPYDLDPAVDFSTPLHAMSRHVPYLQIEFRQDEVALPEGQIRWARLLADALVRAGFTGL